MKTASIMPDSFPSCFRDEIKDETNTHSPDLPNNTVMCIYQAKRADCSMLVTVEWRKSFLGQGFSLHIHDLDHQFLCKIEIRPWLFWRKHGCKCITAEGKTMEVYWDLASAKYSCSPEPQEDFYVVVVCDREVILILGDMQQEAIRKIGSGTSVMVSTLVSKKEHLFGKQIYSTKAQFGEKGLPHDVVIECHKGDVKDMELCVRIDKQTVLQVHNLAWKFRGNHAIMIDGTRVEVFWDVHNWIFNSSCQHAVFMFQTCGNKEMPWMREVGVPSNALYAGKNCKDKEIRWFTDSSCASILQWPDSCSFMSGMDAWTGFCLLLYAWRME